MNYEEAVQNSTLVDYKTAVLLLKKHNIFDKQEINKILRECRVPRTSHVDTEVYSTGCILKDLGH